MAEEKLVSQDLLFEILSSIQGVLGEQNQSVFAKTGRMIGAKWAASIPKAASVDDLMEKIAVVLKDELHLADSVSFERENADYVIKMRGCHLCHSRLVKERHGISPACAVSMAPAGALKANLEVRNIRLKEIRKPGPEGDCDWVYEIKA